MGHEFPGARDLVQAFAGGGRIESNAFNSELRRLTAARSQQALLTRRVAEAFQESSQAGAVQRLEANEAPSKELDILLGRLGASHAGTELGRQREITNTVTQGLVDRVGGPNEPSFAEINKFGAITGGGRNVTGTGVNPEADSAQGLALDVARTFAEGALEDQRQASAQLSRAKIVDLQKKVATSNLKPSALSASQLKFLNDFALQTPNPDFDPDARFLGFKVGGGNEFIENKSSVADFYAFQSREVGDSTTSAFLNADFALMKYLESRQAGIETTNAQRQDLSGVKDSLYDPATKTFVPFDPNANEGTPRGAGAL